MKRIYVYSVLNQDRMNEIIQFANRNQIEVDYYRIEHRKKLYFRVPAGCSHSLFILRFGDCVSLVDKTWEMGVVL